MNTIIKRVFQNELKYDETVILTYQIEYPELIDSNYAIGQKKFNDFNKKKAMELKQYSEGELFKNAKSTYEYNKEHGYPIMVYQVILKYTITFQNQNIISLYSDNFQFTGGAHGNTIREAQNWELQTANQIPLSYFYPNNPYYLLQIVQQINTEIQYRLKKEPSTYFDNYCELVLQNFKLDNYLIYPNYLAIFFQAYDIAPYSTGIPTFKIDYQK